MSSSLRTGSSAVTRTRNTKVSGEGSFHPEMDRSRSNARQSRVELHEANSEGVTMPNINALKSLFQGGNQAPQARPSLRTSAPGAKIHRVDTAEKTLNEAKSHNSAASEPQKPDVDPESMFENTNHTQRFKHTRAIFAKMEEQTQKEKMENNKQFQRSKSPTRYQPSRLALSPMNSVEGLRLTSPPSSDSESRSMLSPQSRWGQPRNTVQAKEQAVVTQNQGKGSSESRNLGRSFSESRPKETTTATTHQTSSMNFRVGSVDSLDSSEPSNQLGKVLQSKANSKSETALLAKEGKDPANAFEDDIPPPKWIMKNYEQVVKGSQTGGSRRVSENASSSDEKSPSANKFGKSSPSTTLSGKGTAPDRPVETSWIKSDSSVNRLSNNLENERAAQKRETVTSELKNGRQPVAENSSVANSAASYSSGLRWNQPLTDTEVFTVSRVSRSRDSVTPEANNSNVSSFNHSGSSDHSRTYTSTFVHPKISSSSSVSRECSIDSLNDSSQIEKKSAAIIRTSVSDESDSIGNVAETLAAWKTKRRGSEHSTSSDKVQDPPVANTESRLGDVPLLKKKKVPTATLR